MSLDVPTEAIDAIREIARQHEYAIERIVVFGSWATGEGTATSDVDIVIVSPDWEGIEFYERPRAFVIEWPREELPTPDIHPLTPEEFEDRSQTTGEIIRTAIEDGIVYRPVSA
jgi:predicted nucleotidyltransferase